MKDTTREKTVDHLRRSVVKEIHYFDEKISKTNIIVPVLEVALVANEERFAIWWEKISVEKTEKDPVVLDHLVSNQEVAQVLIMVYLSIKIVFLGIIIFITIRNSIPHLEKTVALKIKR